MICSICGHEMKCLASCSRWSFYRCNDCGFYSCESIDANDDVIYDYDNYGTFDEDRFKFDIYVEEATRMLKIKFDILGYCPNSFIDIGCSEGVWVKAFSNISNGISSGIEVAIPKVERGKERGLNIGSYDEIKGKYDFVFLRHVIEHVDNPKDFLYNIAEQYCAEGGVVCIETPNNNSIYDVLKGNKIIDGRFYKELYPPTHLCGFVPKTFEKLDGFEVIKNITYGHNDSDWYFDVEREHKSINKLLTNLKLNSNIFVLLKYNRDNNLT